jgi:hypothetical protein
VGPLNRDRREHGVQTNTPGKQPIDVRAGVIEATTGDPGKTHRESTDRLLIADIAVSPGESVATVDPDTRPRIDQDVGDPRIGEERLQRASPQDLRGQLGASSEDTALAKNDGVTIENLRNQDLCGSPALPDLRPHGG